MSALQPKLQHIQQYFQLNENLELILIKRRYRSDRIKIGEYPGTYDKQSGYWSVILCGHKYKLHRIVYQLFNNLEVIDDSLLIDHIDQNKSNNHPANLRLANNSENCYNRKLHENNKSGHKCISWYKQTNKWRVQIRLEGKVINIGYYFTLEDAISARDNAISNITEYKLSYIPA